MARCDKCGYLFTPLFERQSFCHECHSAEKRITKLAKINTDTPQMRLIKSLRAKGKNVNTQSKPGTILRAICEISGVQYLGMNKKRAKRVINDYIQTGKLVLPKSARVETKKAAKPQPTIDFLHSREWRELRYKALQKYGRRCVCCGRSPEDGIILHVDHIKPRSKFPELALALTNLQILCADCNVGKGAWDQTDFRPKLTVIEGGK